MTLARAAIDASLVVPPVVALLATIVIVRGTSVSTATGAEVVQPVAGDSNEGTMDPPTSTS